MTMPVVNSPSVDIAKRNLDKFWSNQDVCYDYKENYRNWS